MPGVAVSVGDAAHLDDVTAIGGRHRLGQGFLEGARHVGHRFAQFGIHGPLALEFVFVIGLELLGFVALGD